MIRKVIGAACILNGLSLLGWLAYYATLPGFSANNPIFLVVLYLLPVLIGIGVLKNSIISIWLAIIFFTFQLWAFYELNFSMPLKLSYEIGGAEGGLRLDISAIAMIILCIVALFKKPIKSKSQQNVEAI